MNVSTIYAILIVLIMSMSCFASDWYEGIGEVTLGENITFEEARRKAFERAMVNAMRLSSIEITDVTGRSVFEDEKNNQAFDNFIQITRTKSRGHIIDIDTLYDKLSEIPVANGKPILVYKAHINALIKIHEERPDPGFKVSIDLNQQTYRNGEEMTIKLSATKDCYVTIFNLYANDSLLVIYPNIMMKDNFVKANSVITIPHEEANWTMPVGLMPDAKKAAEALVAIACKRPVQFLPREKLMREGLMSQGDALLAINRWIVDMRADERAEDWQYYTIVER